MKQCCLGPVAYYFQFVLAVQILTQGLQKKKKKTQTKLTKPKTTIQNHSENLLANSSCMNQVVKGQWIT